MQILSATKETKETLQNRRNLFGLLGLTSLIAACSGADKAAGDGGDPAPLPFKADKTKDDLAEAKALTEAQANGYTATPSDSTGSLTVVVEKPTPADTATLNFADGSDTNAKAGIYQLTTDTSKYDLVISASIFDKDQTNPSETQKGRVFIYWDVATVTIATSPRLEIKGGIVYDRIGRNLSEFFQLGGATEGGYDMVIRSHLVDKSDAGGSSANEGAIYILWDVANYNTSAGKTIDLDPDKIDDADVGNVLGLGATAGSLAIYGAKESDAIGTHAPEFLQLGGAKNKYDMVIRSEGVDKPGSDGTADTNEGAIYVLWDINDYYQDENGANLNKRIDLEADDTGNYATAGLLTIYGSTASDNIGTYAPEFLQLGGKDGDNKLDMVIRSDHVDKPGTRGTIENVGAIYILWDINDYYQDENGANLNKRIDLGAASDSDPNYATAGLLTIYGSTENDNIGTYAPEFLQLGGKNGDNKLDMVIRSDKDDLFNIRDNEGAIYILWDVADYAGENINITLNDGADGVKAESDLLTIKGGAGGDQIGIYAPEFLQLGKENDKYDLVIRSEYVNKTPDSAGANTGAIYVLWDVADYAGGNKTINLTSFSSDASSGLLTIYGATAGSMLGSSNILYRADSEDSDVDGDGTNDLVFENGGNTYVLFGDKIATTTTTTTTTTIDGVEKVDSKTIDLGMITGISANAEGFFGYSGIEGNAGYRFAGSKDFAAVKADFPSPTATDVGLSDTDADLGVWDIA